MNEEKQVVKYSKLNKRMVAVSIDMLIVTLFLNPIMNFLEKLIYMGRTPYIAIMDYAQNEKLEGQTIDLTSLVNVFINEGLIGKFIVMQLIPFLILGTYFIVCWTRFGYTIGGYFFSISVTLDDEKFSRITALRAFARFLASFLCYFTLGLGYIMVSFNSKGKALHDKITNTVVINRKPDFSLVEKLGFRTLSKKDS